MRSLALKKGDNHPPVTPFDVGKQASVGEVREAGGLGEAWELEASVESPTVVVASVRYLRMLQVHTCPPPKMELCGKPPWRNFLMMISQIDLVMSCVLSDDLRR